MFLALSITLGTIGAANAQNNAKQGKATNKKIARLDSALNLNVDQERQMKEIFSQQHKIVKQENEAMRKLQRQRMKERIEMENKMRAVLTPQQAARFDSLNQARTNAVISHRVDAVCSIMKDKANLTDAQKESVRQVLQDHYWKMHNIKTQNLDASDDEIAEKRMAARKEMKSKIAGILSPEQIAKWKEFKKSGMHKPARK